MSKQVLIPIANGSEEIEVVTIADILRRAKVDVVVASVEKTLKILGSQGTKIVADMLISRAAQSTFDLIILPVRQTTYRYIVDLIASFLIAVWVWKICRSYLTELDHDIYIS